jgi:transcriptional regulator with XRE-family HTH domain
VTAPRDLPRDIGGFIRDLRRNAQISLRQLAEQAGVSNPYLSQIERGLRKPSAEVLAQLAHALRVSTPLMYLRAGLLDASGGQGVPAAIAADPDLNIAQKQSLTQIYETFRRENLRTAADDNNADLLTFEQSADAGTQKVTDSEPPEPSAAGVQSAGRGKSAAGTATAGRTASGTATRKAATTRKATTAGKSSATGRAAAAGSADGPAAPARKPRKAATRQPRATQHESTSEAPSVEGSGTSNAKERTEETA